MTHLATRRSKGDGSLRKRPDGRWEARYTVTDLSGEPVRKAVYGKTQKEVREKLKLALADYEYYGYKEPEKVTIRERIIRYNPARDLKSPKLIQKEIRILGKDEQKKLIDSLEGHRLKLLYLLALATGMWRGELLALTWDCIDFENKTISVKQSINRVRNTDGKGSQLIITEPKSKAGRRTIPLVSSLVSVLEEHRKTQTNRE